MDKQIFKVGDRVFDIHFGWGEVKTILTEGSHTIHVKFVNGIDYNFTKDGKSFEKSINPTLSFTEYNLTEGGFSQKRPINYEEYIGKWGVFWDTNPQHFRIMGKLVGYIQNSKKPFKGISHNFRYFEPLTEEEVKMLNLKS